MIIERMSEQQLIKEELNIRVERNIDSDMEDFATLFARYSLDLEDTPPLGIAPPEIAKSLSSVKIEDSYITERIIGISDNPNEATPDDLFFIGALALGAAMVREKNSFLTPEEKKNLSRYKDKIKSEVRRKITGATKKVMSVTTLLAFLNSACGTKITPPNPDLTPTSESVPTEHISTPTEIVPTPTEEAIVKFPEEEINQLQEQLKAQGLETEIVENEDEFVLSDINRTKAVEIGAFRLENDQCVFAVIKSNGEEITYPVSQLGIDEEDNRLVIKDETGRINFRYYPELQKLKQEIEFPYLELSTESGRFNLMIGESMEDDVKSIEWNNNIPPLRYQDPETGEIRMLTPQERFDEVVFVAFWSLATTQTNPAIDNSNISLAKIREGVEFKYENNKEEIIIVDTSKPLTVIYTYIGMPSEGQKFTKASITKFWTESEENELSIAVLVATQDFLEGYGYGAADWAESVGDGQMNMILRHLSDSKVMRGEEPLGIRYRDYKESHPRPEVIQILAELIFQLDYDEMSRDREGYELDGPTRFVKKGVTNNIVIVQTH